jgi:hypothetical protein
MLVTFGKFRFLFIVAVMLVLSSGFWNIRQRSQTNITGYVDPEYAYLMNSLAVSTGRPTGHWDHPGLTQQILGGLLLHTVESSSARRIENILRDPEKYIVFLEYCTLLISSFFLVWSWWHFYRATHDRTATALFVLGPLTHPEYFTQIGRLTPDYLMLALSSFLLAMVVRLLLSKASDQGTGLNVYQAMFIAVLVTLTALTKITSLFLLTFVCLITIQTFLKQHLHRRGLQVALVMLSVFGVLAGCIYLSVGGLYKMFLAYFYNWISNIAAHQDNYGSGAIGFYNWSRLPANILASIQSAPFVYAALLYGIVTTFKLDRRCKNWQVHYLPLIVLVFLHILTTLKAPQGRYLWPITPLAALLLYTPQWSLVRVQKWLRPITLLFVMMTVMAGFWSGYQAFDIRIASNKKSAEIMATSRRFACTLIDFDNVVPSVTAALFFGNNFSHRNFTTELDALYPNYFNLSSNGVAYDFARSDKADKLLKLVKSSDGDVDKYCCVVDRKDQKVMIGRFVLDRLSNVGDQLSLYHIQ